MRTARHCCACNLRTMKLSKCTKRVEGAARNRLSKLILRYYMCIANVKKVNRPLSTHKEEIKSLVAVHVETPHRS